MHLRIIQSFNYLLFAFLLIWGAVNITSYFILDRYLDSGVFNKVLVEKLSLNPEYNYTLRTKSHINWNPLSFGLNFSKLELYDENREVLNINIKEIELRFSILRLISASFIPKTVNLKKGSIAVDFERVKLIKESTVEEINKIKKQSTLSRDFSKVNISNLAVILLGEKNKTHFIKSFSFDEQFTDYKMNLQYSNSEYVRNFSADFDLKIDKNTASAKLTNINSSLSTNKVSDVDPPSGLDINLKGKGKMIFILDGALYKIIQIGFDLGALKGTIQKGEDVTDIKSIYTNGIYLRRSGRLKLDDFKIVLGDSTAWGRGLFEARGSDRVYDMELEVDKISATELLKIWPERLLGSARIWFSKAVLKGVILNAKTKFGFVFDDTGNFSVEKSSLEASSNGENFIIDCCNSKVPIVKDAKGHLEGDLHKLNVTLQSAKISESTIKNGKLTFDEHKNLHIEGDGFGLLKDLIKIYDPNYKLPIFGYDILGSIGGEGDIKLELDFNTQEEYPHIKKQVSVISPNLDATLTESGLKFASSATTMFVDDNSIEFKTNGIIEGHPAAFNSSIALTPSASHYKFDGMIPYTFLRPIFGSIIEPIAEIDGIVKINLDSTQDTKKTTHKIILDLKNSKLSAPYIKLKKPEGEEAKLDLVMIDKGNENYEVQKFHLNSNIGLISIKKIDSRPGLIKLNDIEYKNNFIESFSIKDSKSKLETNILARDLHYDDFSWLDFGGNNSINKASSPLSSIIKTHINNLIFPKEVVLSGLDITINCKRELCDQIRATKNDGSEITANFVMNGDEVTFDTNDAGLFLRAFDITNSIEGGFMRINSYIRKYKDKTFAWQNHAKIKNFQVTHAPILARILSFTSLTGLLNTLLGRGLIFNDMAADFVLYNQKATFALSTLEGESIGLSFEGVIDLANKNIDIEGSVMPFNIINLVGRKIPFIGKQIVGSRGKGLFTIDFKLKGDPSNPSVNVNPISTMMPYAMKRFLKDREEYYNGEVPEE